MLLMETDVKFSMVEVQCDRSYAMDFTVWVNILVTVWDGEASWINVIRMGWFMRLKWTETEQSLGLIQKSLASSVLSFL